MKRNALLAAGCLLVGAFILAGCGGDDDGDDGGDGGDAPTKADYIAQADEVCSESNAELEQAIEDAPATEAPPEDFIVDELLPIYRDEFASLRELTPPEGDEDTVAAIYDAGERGIGEIEADPAAFQQGGAQAAPGLTEASDLATDYGFEVCGQGGD